jgi:hypothetical protein
MKKLSKALLAVAATIVFFAPRLSADTASMQLTGAGSTVLGGVYIGPYTATINGVSTTVICDDFAHDSWLNESWTATLNNAPSLSNTLWGNNPQLYNEAAWLAMALWNPANASQAGYIQFALWAVFTPGALNYLDQNGMAQASWWLAQAQSQTWTPGEFSNIAIYTAVPGSGYCGKGPCPTSTPQEFLVLTPEPEITLQFAIGIFMLALAWGIRRRTA